MPFPVPAAFVFVRMILLAGGALSGLFAWLRYKSEEYPPDADASTQPHTLSTLHPSADCTITLAQAAKQYRHKKDAEHYLEWTGTWLAAGATITVGHPENRVIENATYLACRFESRYGTRYVLARDIADACVID